MPKNKNMNQRRDGIYLLKLLFFTVLGIQWLRIKTNGLDFPLPYGALIGLLFAAHDHFAIDRKIEYAVLVIAMLIGFFIPVNLILEF